MAEDREFATTKLEKATYSEEDIAKARRINEFCQRNVGKTIKPADYPKWVAAWNVAIAILHGTVFDCSRDRERGMVPSG
jgi:hypothetical protein